ncbi:FAD-binding monooxygenase [Actinoplanes sp. LDG1-06]|uniref:FAD-binding monooxygenase n=1 Tax=Paractinoplanes ovalisporus TaxID=2810368 RepID=A0ABS2AJR6_9ACTN|nr:FAD-binding monooxygenase [Actinoplanes ovalisporus]MBM2620098.1 FAD-binding monooxygenase [Actinoplanes ovalisporus]
MPEKVGARAVVLGGSVTGLYAASPLSEHYDEVVIVDRDEIVGVDGPRRGAPQARHINGLLVKGARVMEELFPEIIAEMIRDGCPQTDMTGTVRWYMNGKRLKQTRAGMTNIGARRPILEAHIRRRVEALGNVVFKQRYDLTGLVFSADRSRVTGVKVQRNDGKGVEEILDADLVIDATGRGSRTPVWLEDNGYPRVAEEGSKIGLGYVTRHYRLRTDPFGNDHSIVTVANPGLPRGAIFTKTDAGLVELTAYGLLGDHPPTDPEGYNAFLKTLAAPEIHEAVVEAEPINDPVLFRFPTTLRRRYDRMERMPEGLLVMGDAVCTPNPVFAQAQSLAALQALALRDELRKGEAPDALAFTRIAGKIVDPAWEMTEGINLSFPGVEGKRTAAWKAMQAYMARLQFAATRDPKVTEAFMRVAGLVDPLPALMAPALALRVLRHSLPPMRLPAAIAGR